MIQVLGWRELEVSRLVLKVANHAKAHEVEEEETLKTKQKHKTKEEETSNFSKILYKRSSYSLVKGRLCEVEEKLTTSWRNPFAISQLLATSLAPPDYGFPHNFPQVSRLCLGLLQ